MIRKEEVMIYLIDLPGSANILYILGIMLGICIPLIITLLIARFRGFFASIFSMPFFIALFSFLIKISSISNFLESNAFSSGVSFGLQAADEPFDVFHKLVISLLAQIAPSSSFYIDNILCTQWFRIALYGILFIVFFIFFHKKKAKKAKTDDDF